jgi:hypothetical protein
VIRSIGHLVGYTANGTPYNYAFRYADALTYSMPKGPTWLKVDPKTGQLAGSAPRAADKPVEVELNAVSQTGGQDRQRFDLHIMP